MVKSGKQTAEAYTETGRAKAEMSTLRMFVGGIFAGAFIAFGALGSQIVSFSLSPVSLSKAVGCLFFPIGLLMVVITGAELFTGNNLMTLSALTGKASWKGVLKNWCFVYLGNLVGSLFVAAMAVYGHVLFAPELVNSAVATASAKCSLTLGDALIKGVLCNILVCTAVFVGLCAEEQAGRIIGLYLPTALFVLCGFEHCIANMFFIPEGIFAAGLYGIEAPALSWGAMILKNLIPVTIGNLIGGAGLFAGGIYLFYLKKN